MKRSDKARALLLELLDRWISRDCYPDDVAEAYTKINRLFPGPMPDPEESCIPGFLRIVEEAKTKETQPDTRSPLDKALDSIAIRASQ